MNAHREPARRVYFVAPSASCWAVLLASTLGWGPAAAQTPMHPPQVEEVLNGTCSHCHSCEKPSAEHPCVRPCTRGEAARRLKEFESRTGPRVVILDELERVYLPVPFDHAGHAAMAQMAGGCSVCHHYTPEGQDHPACKTCHGTAAEAGDIRKPGLKGAYHRQCLSCHREWSGDTRCDACHQSKTSAGESASVGKSPTVDDIVGRMHPPIPEPTEELYRTSLDPDEPPAKVLFRHKEHIDRYGLRCAECHREDNCNRCHAEGRRHEQQVRTFEQHHKPCFDCHRKDACERCHFDEAKGPPPPFDHASTGWPLSRYHRTKNCRACHVAAPFTAPRRDCNACHADWNGDTFDHAVTGQLLNETHAGFDCDACHKDRRFEAAPLCDGCHDAEEGVAFPSKRPGPTTTISGG